MPDTIINFTSEQPTIFVDDAPLVSISQLTETLVVILEMQGPAGRDGRDGGLTFSTVASDTVMSPDTEYLCNAGGAHRIVFTLPTTIAAGQKLNIYGRSIGGWSLTIGAGQFVEYNGNEYDNTTVIESSDRYGNILLLCIEDNIRFLVLSANAYQTIP
ncbi:MAG: hypothetical protein JSS75_07110 [Bacteroidetes bacterium]|nr:hypothetical protein [Bacteroidota bacterium]